MGDWVVEHHEIQNSIATIFLRWMWMFPKIGGFPPKSSILIGFSIIFTIHFGVPLFLETPKYLLTKFGGFSSFTLATKTWSRCCSGRRSSDLELGFEKTSFGCEECGIFRDLLRKISFVLLLPGFQQKHPRAGKGIYFLQGEFFCLRKSIVCLLLGYVAQDTTCTYDLENLKDENRK